MDLGGGHVQFNVVSSETLRDAQLHPEKYQDLVVRVACFSAFFIHLDLLLTQDMSQGCYCNRIPEKCQSVTQYLKLGLHQINHEMLERR